MGLTFVDTTVEHPRKRAPRLRARFLVDTGAVYTVLPERLWRRLGLTSTETAEFVLADGTAVRRGLAECRFGIAGRIATSPVVLGEGDDAPLLGAVTLETLRLMVDPLSRRLHPMRILPLKTFAACADGAPGYPVVRGRRSDSVVATSISTIASSTCGSFDGVTPITTASATRNASVATLAIVVTRARAGAASA